MEDSSSPDLSWLDKEVIPLGIPAKKCLVTMERRELLALELPAPSWLVPNLVPAASLVFFVGKPGSYKTFMAMKVACSLASGARLFDETDCSADEFSAPLAPCSVLFVEEENNASLVQARVRKISALPPDPSSLHFALSTGFKLSDPAHLAELREFCVANKVKCVFLDPFSSVCGVKDENDNAGMSTVLDGLRRAIVDDLDVGATVVCIHHPSKGQDGSGSLRGAGDIMGKADHAVQFEIDEGTRCVGTKVIKCRQEDRFQIPEYSVQFRNMEDRIVVALATRDTEKKSEKKTKAEEMHDSILLAFSALGGRAEQKTVVEYLGLKSRTGTFTAAWKTLADFGEILYDQNDKKFSLKIQPLSSSEVSRIYQSAPPVDPDIL